MSDKKRNSALRHIVLEPTLPLLGLSLIIPTALFLLASWENYRVVLKEANTRVEKTVDLLQEHATKVFETHRLVLNLVDERIRFLDWSKEADRSDLYQMLKRVQDDLDQVATVTVTDTEGRMIASGRTYPADPKVSFADRDWFQELKRSETKLPFVSKAYKGRQSGQAVFNVASRLHTDASGQFEGAIAVSVDRAYFENLYKRIEPGYDHTVSLIRTDGTILVRDPETTDARVKPNSPFVVWQRTQPLIMTASSGIDGVERMYSFRHVGNYPVYVGFSVSMRSALAPWRRNLMLYGLIAAVAALALLAASRLAIYQAKRERVATMRWRETASRLRVEAAERTHVEGQLRQSLKMEAVGRLTGGVAHDFNNLLTVITGSLDLLRRRMKDDDPRAARLVSSALEGANRAAALTHRLLAFSRQQPLEPKPVDCNRLVTDLSDLLRRTLGENIAIETVLGGGLWRTFADPNQLENALLNLAVNARDAMPQGGKLTIETANLFLDEAYASQHAEVIVGQYVQICVSDTGSGMPVDVVAKAFEPFFTTKPIGKGTGLGLSQVYGFAKQSHGHVAIYSEEGHGTSVKLYLPKIRQVDDVAVVAPVAMEMPIAASKGETILVVEDEDMVRAFSVAALRESGYRVLEATNAADGLALLRLHPDVALLFTDVILKGEVNGRALADEAALLRPDLLILFTTGYSRNAIIHQGRLDDGVHFLGKPFTVSALSEKVHYLLSSQAAAGTV